MSAEAYNRLKDIVLEYRNQYDIMELWFRGEPNVYPSMPSTLYRQVDFVDESEAGRVISKSDQQLAVDYETWIYEKFKSQLESKNRDLYLSITENPWDIVFYMQHYGIPTRFIDWSEDINTSLFFATEKAFENNDDVVLWMLNPEFFNGVIKGMHQIYHPAPTHTYKDFIDSQQSNYQVGSAISSMSDEAGIQPSMDIERMMAQYGHFVYIPKDYSDMRTYIEDIAAEKDIQKDQLMRQIIISNSDARSINSHLESIGCNAERYKLTTLPVIDKEDFMFRVYTDDETEG